MMSLLVGVVSHRDNVSWRGHAQTAYNAERFLMKHATRTEASVLIRDFEGFLGGELTWALQMCHSEVSSLEKCLH